MTNIEQIKSEDLAAQVQDANPANFAIEQEVAALVGATVPAPTEPSADDARELGAQLLVFLRRALTPIRSALRTAVAAIYAHLDSRCTDYTPAAYAPYIPRPYDPMGTPPTPRTLPNLLTALTAFSARKISNGSAPSDGIPDGTSLAHLCCETNSVSIVRDDNTDWTMNRDMAVKNFIAMFPSATEIHFGCKAATAYVQDGNITRSQVLYFDNCKSIPDGRFLGAGSNSSNDGLPNFEVHFPALETSNMTANYYGPVYCGKLYLEGYKSGQFRVGGSASYSNPHTTYIYCGCKGKPTDTIRFWQNVEDTQLVDFEIGQGARQPITLENVTGLTAENIVNHIFDKLADNSDGDPITINIGSTNLAKLTDEQKAIAQNKNYTLA